MYIDIARQEGCTVWQPDVEVPKTGYFIPPTLVLNVQPVSRCVQEEVKIFSLLILLDRFLALFWSA